MVALILAFLELRLFVFFFLLFLSALETFVDVYSMFVKLLYYLFVKVILSFFLSGMWI